MSTAPAKLTLHMHPLASYCWKVLLALYESGTPFETIRIDGVPRESDQYTALWPMAKMPLLQDGERVIPETTIIIEYLQSHRAGNRARFPSLPPISSGSWSAPARSG